MASYVRNGKGRSTQFGSHALVLGASVAGLLAARVLSEFYETVTVVERDVLSDEPETRKGVPQGRHLHALLGRGALTIEELFPGLLHEMVSDGASVWDDGDLSKVYLKFGGHELVRTGAIRDPQGLAMYMPSRPFLECHIRRRLRKLPNVTILDGFDVSELCWSGDDQRVTGALVVSRKNNEQRSLSAELTLDATGRGSRLPAFLAAHGYDRPTVDEVVVHMSYGSQLLRIPKGTVREKMIAIGAAPERPVSVGMMSLEGDTWISTVSGFRGYEPPLERDALLKFVEDSLPPDLTSLIQAATPINEPVSHHVPSNRWRRYDKMARFPEGLLVSGDAICSFNPVYAQGMTIAALDALRLRQCLQKGPDALRQRYFQAVAKVVDVAWQTATGSDLAIPSVKGQPTRKMRIANKYVQRVLGACESNPVIAERFLRVLQLIDPASRLLRPLTATKALMPQRRTARSQPSQVAV